MRRHEINKGQNFNKGLESSGPHRQGEKGGKGGDIEKAGKSAGDGSGISGNNKSDRTTSATTTNGPAFRARTKRAAIIKGETMSEKKREDKRELIDTGSDKRFVRRDDEGQFKESDDVGRSLGRDVQQAAKTKVKKGQGDRGDQ